jgi:Tfp pilus assembly protein PilO
MGKDEIEVEEVEGVAATHWAIDKRVPVALLAGLLLQLVAGVWYASALASKVDAHTERLVKLETADQLQVASLASISERLARIDERQLAQNETLRLIREALAARGMSPQP